MSDPLFCTSCGHTGKPRSETPGSLLIEIILWLCILIPGIIYTVWRHNRRHDVCEKCGSAALIPPDSPIAKSFYVANPGTAPMVAVSPPVRASAGSVSFGRWLGRKFSQLKR